MYKRQGIDIELQMLGERLLEGKIGSIVAIEPSTGEILCMVSEMCIRDRSLPAKAIAKAKVPNITTTLNTFILHQCSICIRMAVSYTHLDVYKRQVRGC